MNIFKSKVLFYMLVVCALALPLIVGTSYAIYAIDDPESTTEKVQLTTSNLKVDFIANEYITNAGARLIKSEEVEDRADFSTFTIISSSETSNEIKYSINISNIETTYDEELKTFPLLCEDFKYRLVKLNNEEEIIVTEGNFSGVENNNLEITENLELKLLPGEKVNYKLYIWLEETTENQNHLLNRTFKSKITINSVLL